jgi:NAD(P)-dependent dehydrogenase (short-subunit alcohol dehydrogenase family)
VTLTQLASSHCLSAGVSGPLTSFLNDPQAPENANAETLGNALFNDDGMDAWATLYKINTFSIYYMTTAFLGLLDKGSREIEGYTSSVVNITSISGILKIAQRHVSIINPCSWQSVDSWETKKKVCI